MKHNTVPSLVAAALFLMTASLMVVGVSADPAAPGAQLGSAIKIGKAAVSRPKFSEEDEERMAQAQAKKFDAQNTMWPEPLLEQYMTGLVQKLVAVAPSRPFPYRVRVVSNPGVNAFTFGGGLLYVNAGLIARMENEAQLSMVLAHEIAHITEGHVVKGIQSAYNKNLIGSAAVIAGSATGVLPSGQALEVAYESTMNAAVNGYGRNQERDADRIGIDYLVKAGYDPREGPIVFELLLKEYGDKSRLTNFFYGSHPNNVERFETLTALIKSKYAKDVKEKRLAVNTEEFKRVTRRVVIETGRLDYEQSRLLTAQAMMEKAVRSWQDDPEPHYYLGKLALEAGVGGGVDEALTHFANALKADAKFAPAYRDQGLALYRKGDRPGAIASLERYLQFEGVSDADKKQIETTIQELKRR